MAETPPPPPPPSSLPQDWNQRDVVCVDCVKEVNWTHEGQRWHLTCSWIHLFKGAPVRHFSHLVFLLFFFYVDFATIPRKVVYSCCSRSLDFIIWCIVFRDKKKERERSLSHTLRHLCKGCTLSNPKERVEKWLVLNQTREQPHLLGFVCVRWICALIKIPPFIGPRSTCMSNKSIIGSIACVCYLVGRLCTVQTRRHKAQSWRHLIHYPSYQEPKVVMNSFGWSGSSLLYNTNASRPAMLGLQVTSYCWKKKKVLTLNMQL